MIRYKAGALQAVSSWVLHPVLGGLREKRKRLYFQSKALTLDIKCSDVADCSYILNNWGYAILVNRGHEHCLEDDGMVLHQETLWRT